MSPRRPALDILRDVRAHGAELKGDIVSAKLGVIGTVPAWLYAEVQDRRLDLQALCEEFDVPAARAVFTAETLLAKHASRRR